MFFYIKCVLFVLVLSISGEISAQEKRDSVRIYFHQGKVNIDTCLLDNGNEMERFAKICSALNDSVRLIRKIQIIGGASPEGGGLLNGRLSEKRAEVLWRYISPYIKIPVLEWDFHFSGSDWNGLITMVRADVNVPEREDVLRLLEKIVRLENQDSPYLRGELKRLKGGRPYSYLYKFHFPKLRSSMVSKYSINSLVYWVTYVHNVVYSFYRSMIYCYINSTQRCAGSIVIDIIPTNGADKRKFFPFAPYFPVTNVIKRYFYPYFPAIIGIKGYSFPYFPYLSGIMKIKTALYSLFSRLDWHKTVVFPCLGEIYEGIRSLSWEIPVT